jgi:hypothetical protein
MMMCMVPYIWMEHTSFIVRGQEVHEGFLSLQDEGSTFLQNYGEGIAYQFSITSEKLGINKLQHLETSKLAYRTVIKPTTQVQPSVSAPSAVGTHLY